MQTKDFHVVFDVGVSVVKSDMNVGCFMCNVFINFLFTYVLLLLSYTSFPDWLLDV